MREKKNIGSERISVSRTYVNVINIKEYDFVIMINNEKKIIDIFPQIFSIFVDFSKWSESQGLGAVEL